MRASWTAFAKGGSGLQYGDVAWPLFPKCMTITGKPSADELARFSKESGFYQAWRAALDKNGFTPLPSKDPNEWDGGLLWYVPGSSFILEPNNVSNLFCATPRK